MKTPKIIKVALVEDDALDLIKIEMMLANGISKRFQFEIVGIYQSLETLIELVQNKAVDIIVSDIFRDKKPIGIELLKKLSHNTIPVVLITHVTHELRFSK